MNQMVIISKPERSVDVTVASAGRAELGRFQISVVDWYHPCLCREAVPDGQPRSGVASVGGFFAI
jgi:hypothetical protein